MFVKLQGCMPVNGCCCCDSLYVLYETCIYTCEDLFLYPLISEILHGLEVLLLAMYRQGLTGNLYPHLLSFPLSKLAIFVGQMSMSITNNSWRWLMTSNPTLQGLPSKPWTFHGDFFVDPCNSWWNLCPYQLPHRRQRKNWVAVAFAPVA